MVYEKTGICKIYHPENKTSVMSIVRLTIIQRDASAKDTGEYGEQI
jgi:hypothetical protein